MSIDTTDASIPPSARALAPYIRTRQDVRRIRQALTLYLQSHIVSVADDDDDDAATTNINNISHLSLGVPIDPSVDVKRIPSNLTGVRKEFLKALQENAAARREYDELSHTIASRKLLAQNSPPPSRDPDAHRPLHDYLSLLRENRRYEKLRLFEQSLDKLTTETQSVGDLAVEGPQDTLLDQGKLDGLWNGSGSTREPAGDAQALISKLERTVLRAKAKLTREQNLLKELKARQLSERASNHYEESTTRRAVALQRVRDELVQWVEEKLVTANPEEAAQFEDLSERQAADSLQAVEERKAEIREQYAKYVQERKALLEALSLISQPPKSASPAPEKSSKKAPEPLPNTKMAWSSVDLFGPASELLLPKSVVQKSLALQRSYLSALLSKERTNMKHALERLSHESHLLPEYPILARHSKFKHITVGAGGRADRTEGEHTDELVQHAQAWAFASEAASANESDYVEQRIEHGTEMSRGASRTLQQVYDLLNQDNNAATEDTTVDEGDDIWTAEVESHRPRRTRRHKDDQHSGNPWARLNGRIGLDEKGRSTG